MIKIFFIGNLGFQEFEKLLIKIFSKEARFKKKLAIFQLIYN
jgi:hypothetical protein